MAHEAEITALGAALGLLVWTIKRMNDPGPVTVGDEESDVFTDTVEEMKSIVMNWPSGSDPYQNAIKSACEANGVPVSILAWLLWKESRYNPAIISGAKRSSVGAIGIAQFMPATARDMGIDPADPAQAIPAAAKYLAWLYQKTGQWDKALAAYNWGIGNVTRKGIASAPAETVDYYTSIMSKSGYGAYA